MINRLLVAVALSVITVATTNAQYKPRFIANITTLPIKPVPTSVVVRASYATANLKKYITPNTAIATEDCNKLQFKFAQLLDREVESITNTSFFECIDNWWGTRYRYGGTTYKGVDCSSYTGHIYETVYNYKLPRTAREQYAMCVKVNRFNLQEGDLVFFNTRGGVSHVGVYISDGFFTHSSSSVGVTISNLDEAYYSRKYIGGGRVMQPLESYIEQ